MSGSEGADTGGGAVGTVGSAGDGGVFRLMDVEMAAAPADEDAVAMMSRCRSSRECQMMGMCNVETDLENGGRVSSC